MKRWIWTLLAMILVLSACGGQGSWQEQYDLGVRYLTEGNYEEAILAFTAAIEIDPKQPDTYLRLAEAYLAHQNLERAVEILWDGYQNCDGDDRFRDALDALGYIIDDSGRLFQIDWESTIEDIEALIYPPGTSSGNYLTFAQKEEVYLPLIPELETYIDMFPEDQRGYSLLSEIYLRIGQLDLCLEVRKSGFMATGGEILNPNGCIIEFEDGLKMTLDPWGRSVSMEYVDGTSEIMEYGEGPLCVQSEQTVGESLEWERYTYEYEDGRLVSQTAYLDGGNLITNTTYEYPEDGICVIRTSYPVGEYSIITFTEYGQLLQTEYFSADGELMMSHHY